MRLPNQSEPVERSSFSIEAPVDEEIGLGDMVKRVTQKMGIKTCSGCERRAQVLNRWVSFKPRTK